MYEGGYVSAVIFAIDMNIYIQKLYKLQEIEMGPKPGSAENQALIKQLRAEIPEPIVRHYDRLRNRGMTGIAPVRNQSCSGCHMKIPVGTITEIMASEDLKLCEYCSRYLIVLEEEVTQPDPEPLKAEQPKPEPLKSSETPKKRGRKKKKDSQ